MELTAAIALLVAVVVPFVVAVITRPDWSASRKRTIAVVVSVVVAIVVALATGKIDGVPDAVRALVARVLIAAGIIVSLAQGYYSAFKGTLTAIEAATSPQTPPDPQRALVEPSTTAGNNRIVYEPGDGTGSTTSELP